MGAGRFPLRGFRARVAAALYPVLGPGILPTVRVQHPWGCWDALALQCRRGSGKSPLDLVLALHFPWY